MDTILNLVISLVYCYKQTYLRGLEVAELTKSDIPMVQLW